MCHLTTAVFWILEAVVTERWTMQGAEALMHGRVLRESMEATSMSSTTILTASSDAGLQSDGSRYSCSTIYGVKEMNDPVQPTASKPAPAAGPARSSYKTSNERKPPSMSTCCFLADMHDAARPQSEQSKRKGDKKHPSDHFLSSEPRSKRSKSNHENHGNQKE